MISLSTKWRCQHGCSFTPPPQVLPTFTHHEDEMVLDPIVLVMWCFVLPHPWTLSIVKHKTKKNCACRPQGIQEGGFLSLFLESRPTQTSSLYRPQGIQEGGFFSLFLKSRPTQTSSLYRPQGIGRGRFLHLLKPPRYIDHKA
jgi:hypothetical protein